MNGTMMKMASVLLLLIQFLKPKVLVLSMKVRCPNHTMRKAMKAKDILVMKAMVTIHMAKITTVTKVMVTKVMAVMATAVIIMVNTSILITT